MKTKEVLEILRKDQTRSFANVNPHWWVYRDTKGLSVDYSYCGDFDCDCYQRDTEQTEEQILEQFPDDHWEEVTNASHK